MNRPGSGTPQARPGQACACHVQCPPCFIAPCHAIAHTIQVITVAVRQVREEWEGGTTAHELPASCTSLPCPALHRTTTNPKTSFSPPLVTALSALYPSTPRLLNCLVLLLPCPSNRPRTASACVFCPLSLLAGSPHGIRHILHVRVSPRRHLDIGQAWWEQPRHHPTSAVPSTHTATATTTSTSTRWDAHGPSPSPSTIASRTTSSP